MSKATILITHMGLNFGGAETHIVALCKHLVKDLDYNVIVASNGGPYEDELVSYGVKHYKVPLHTKKPLKVLKSYIKLVQIIKNEKVDLIHAHARIPAFICNILSKVYKVNFITTGHYNFRSNFILKQLSFWGEKTIVVSEDLKEYFNKTFDVPYNNMTVITNGIDTEKFKNKTDYDELYEQFNIDDEYKKVLLVSRIDDELAEIILNLINTADELVKNFEKVAIFIVGKGNRLEEVKQAAQQKNEQLGKKVVYITGGIPDITKIMNFCDVFVGISRAALEAMSCKKPVILAGVWSFVGILNENIVKQCKEDNFTGRSFSEPATTENLYESISKVLKMTPEEKTKIGDLGRQIVINDYSSLEMAKKTANVYESVLKGEKANEVN